MLDLLLNYSPTFLVGEVMLALSLGLFGLALAGTVRGDTQRRIRWRYLKQRVVPSKLAYNRPAEDARAYLIGRPRLHFQWDLRGLFSL